MGWNEDSRNFVFKAHSNWTLIWHLLIGPASACSISSCKDKRRILLPTVVKHRSIKRQNLNLNLDLKYLSLIKIEVWTYISKFHPFLIEYRSSLLIESFGWKGFYLRWKWMFARFERFFFLWNRTLPVHFL